MRRKPPRCPFGLAGVGASFDLERRPFGTPLGNRLFILLESGLEQVAKPHLDVCDHMQTLAVGCDDPGNPRSSGQTLRRPTRLPVVVFRKICRPGLMGPISKEASDLIRAWSRDPITVLSGFSADRSFPTTIKKRWHHQHWHRSARAEHLTSLSASTPTRSFTWRSPWPPMAASSVSTESPPLAYLAAGQRAGGTRDTTI